MKVLLTGMRTALKMFGQKTRDLIVETATIVKRVDKSLFAHNKDNEKKFEGIYKLIKECTDSCPAEDKFDAHTKAQNGTLLRMERKYDSFYKEHQSELGGVKNKVSAMEVQKKTKREVLGSWLIYITIAGIITGSSFAYLRYKASNDRVNNKKIEVMFEKILSK
jgi:hypothetical protein